MTFQAIFNAATKKGFRIDSYTNIFNRFGEQISPKTYISVQLKDAIWYTWELDTFWNDDFTKRVYNEDAYLFFNGRYNQNNGATQKTYRREREIQKALGL